MTGVVALLGGRAPSWLKLFLLTLAIADDIGAIVVIAIFYSEGVSLPWLATAILTLVVAYLIRSRVPYVGVYLTLGAVCWWSLHEANIHTTLAGVAFGLLAPVTPPTRSHAGRRHRGRRPGRSGRRRGRLAVVATRPGIRVGRRVARASTHPLVGLPGGATLHVGERRNSSADRRDRTHHVPTGHVGRHVGTRAREADRDHHRHDARREAPDRTTPRVGHLALRGRCPGPLRESASPCHCSSPIWHSARASTPTRRSSVCSSRRWLRP